MKLLLLRSGSSSHFSGEIGHLYAYVVSVFFITEFFSIHIWSWLHIVRCLEKWFPRTTFSYIDLQIIMLLLFILQLHFWERYFFFVVFVFRCGRLNPQIASPNKPFFPSTNRCGFESSKFRLTSDCDSVCFIGTFVHCIFLGAEKFSHRSRFLSKWVFMTNHKQYFEVWNIILKFLNVQFWPPQKLCHAMWGHMNL
jgi:hypothetical protein